MISAKCPDWNSIPEMGYPWKGLSSGITARRNMRHSMARSSKSVEKIEASSGNVFADLGLPDAAQRDTKVRLAVAINRQIKSRRLTQAAAAQMLSINQPKVSALKHYQLD